MIFSISVITVAKDITTPCHLLKMPKKKTSRKQLKHPEGFSIRYVKKKIVGLMIARVDLKSRSKTKFPEYCSSTINFYTYN